MRTGRAPSQNEGAEHVVDAARPEAQGADNHQRQKGLTHTPGRSGEERQRDQHHRGHDRQFYVRQLWDMKGQGDVMTMNRNALTHYGALCAWALARAHARSGDAVQIAAYLGRSDTFDRAIASFAARYARTNGQDHATLLEAIRDRRIEAHAGL